MKFSACAVDLFCGIGGLTHGLIKSGIPVIAGIDNDGSCKYAFEKNNNCRFIEKDIRKVKKKDVESLFPEVDFRILVGCAPCQCFSKHTQKNKARNKDEKWKLLYSFSNLVTEVKPHLVSMENVAEIRKYKVFKDFVKSLEITGYRVFHTVVYCPDYGIPQNRRRLVLLASRLGEINIVPKTHLPSRYRTVRDVIIKLENIGDGETSSKDPLHKTFRLSPINKKRIKQSKPDGTWLDWDKTLRAPCHKKKSGRTYSAVYGRMSWNKPSPTITTQFYSFGTGRFGHPEQDRALSLREGALLQTFPKYYDFIESNGKNTFTALGTHIGNAVPPRLGYIIGKSIKEHIEGIT